MIRGKVSYIHGLNNWNQSRLPSVQFNHWKEDPKEMEGKIPNGIPPFDGSNHEYWSNRMQNYLKALGVDVWFSVVLGYTGFEETKDCSQKEERRNNKMATNVILDRLVDSVKAKVGSCA
jgi:hypothetical protein